MILGKHVSIAGGIDKAPARAREIDCNSLQIFSKNPRGWKGRTVDQDEVKEMKEEMENQGMKKLVVHCTYLINLASPKQELWEKSKDGLKDDYNRSGRLGADYYVLHPGSHTGSGMDNGIKNVAQGLNDVLAQTENNTMVLLENVAGAGTSIGSNFNQLYDIINNVKQKEKIGLCLDTCHAFAAGYDLTNGKGLDMLLSDIDEKIGIDKLKVIHVNDSKYECGTKKDEHAHIGRGKIGKTGFELIINHPQLKGLPLILETPQFEGQDEDVITIKRLKHN